MFIGLLLYEINQLSKWNNCKFHWEWSFFQHYSTTTALWQCDLVWKWSCTGCDVEREFAQLLQLLFYLPKPHERQLGFIPPTTPSSHALRGQMSEVPRLIVMIMSLRLPGAGWGCSAGERVFRRWNWCRERRRGWESGLVQKECHVIFPVIPRPLLWKHCTHSEMHNPCCPSNLTDEQASLTPNQSPSPPPTHGPHGYLSWLGWVYLEAN